MTTTSELDTHAERIGQYLDKADELKRKSNELNSEWEDYRLKAGHELIAARRRVDAGETDLSWSSWCAQYVKRSDRDIRRLMEMASADDPAQAREDEKARNRAAKPAGSRATSPFQAHDEGVGAFLRGVPEADCPHTERKRHAAWRTGWSEMAERTGASPVGAAPAADGVTDPFTELRQAMEKFWPLLSHADQETLIDWQIEHRADPPISAQHWNGPRGARRQPMSEQWPGQG